jgi:hypothetical protein
MRLHRLPLAIAAGATAAVLAACGVPVPAGCEQRAIGTADQVAARETTWSCIDYGLPPGGIAGGASWHGPGGIPSGPVVAYSVDCTGPGNVYGIYVDGAPRDPDAYTCMVREYNAAQAEVKS